MMPPHDPLDLTRSKRLLVVAPHPDDETLATGGLLQRSIAAGGTVRVVFVTDGENNAWPQRVIERRWRLGPNARARWAERRRAETLDALSCLGIPASSAVFLHFPDQGLTSLLLVGGGSLVPTLAAEITTWRPTLVAAPALADRHPDHNAVAVLLRLAVDRLAGAHGPFAELAYVVHGEVPAGALQLPLAPVQRARKYAAILHHRSQLVLSKRRFLSHATETECFVDPGTASPAHRVVGAAFASGTLSLRLVAPTPVAALRATRAARQVLHVRQDPAAHRHREPSRGVEPEVRMEGRAHGRPSGDGVEPHAVHPAGRQGRLQPGGRTRPIRRSKTSR